MSTVRAMFVNRHVAEWIGSEEQAEDVQDVLRELKFEEAGDGTFVPVAMLKAYEAGIVPVSQETLDLDTKLPGQESDKPHSSWMTVTPILAVMFLARMGRNRNLVRSNIDRIKKKLISGQWVCVHQGVAFDVLGKFFDGQHRMAAVIETGIAMTDLQVTVNLPTNAFHGTDRGVAKTPDHILQIAGYVLPGFGGLVKAALVGMGHARYISEADYIKNARLLLDGAEFVRTHLKPKINGMNIAQIRAVLTRAYYSNVTNRDRVKQFCEVLTSAHSPGGSDCPALRFREWVIANPGVRNGKSCHEAYATAEYCLAKFIARDKIKRAKMAEKELFPLPWETRSQSDSFSEDEMVVPAPARSLAEAAKAAGVSIDD